MSSEVGRLLQSLGFLNNMENTSGRENLSSCCSQGCNEPPTMGLPNMPPFAMWCRNHAPRRAVEIITASGSASTARSSSNSGSPPPGSSGIQISPISDSVPTTHELPPIKHYAAASSGASSTSQGSSISKMSQSKAAVMTQLLGTENPAKKCVPCQVEGCKNNAIFFRDAEATVGFCSSHFSRDSKAQRKKTKSGPPIGDLMLQQLISKYPSDSEKIDGNLEYGKFFDSKEWRTSMGEDSSSGTSGGDSSNSLGSHNSLSSGENKKITMADIEKPSNEESYGSDPSELRSVKNTKRKRTDKNS